MSIDGMGKPRRVSIAEALVISKTNKDASIVWRPETNLPESEQYALIYNE